MWSCLCAIFWYLSDTFLIPFCNVGLQKGIRWVSDDSMLFMAEWHLYIPLLFILISGSKWRGDLGIKVKPLPGCRHFGNFLIFFSALDYNAYSYKQLLFKTIKVIQQTLIKTCFMKVLADLSIYRTYVNYHVVIPFYLSKFTRSLKQRNWSSILNIWLASVVKWSWKKSLKNSDSGI